VESYTVRLRIPAGFEIEAYEAFHTEFLPLFETDAVPETLVDMRTLAPILAEPVRYVVWTVQEAQATGARHHYQVGARVNAALRGSAVRSLATAYVDNQAVDQETVEIQVREQSAYLKYLPALYAQDDFMGRFLMLFESFWRPIEQQIDHIHHYLDPELTPARFLPWLASWFKLSVESDEWTEAKQRRLLASIIWLYRKRGTTHALREYLEILTGHPVEIVEHRAKDFRLGRSARLGVGIALGAGNVPHTFGVHVQLDPYTRPAGLDDEQWAKEERRLNDARRRLIEELIANEKPAHTQFTVEYETAE
jgi:phage tail-like protein